VSVTLLLLSPSAPRSGRDALGAAFAGQGRLVAPHWELGDGSELLAAPARVALATLDQQADREPALVCGVAAGALVALQLAGTAPGRVRGIVLCTGVRTVGTVLRSVHRAVAGLLPVRTLQRLGGRGAALVPVLDAVRSVDAGPLAAGVTAPAVVPYGDRDPLNRRPSEQLARSLPAGRALPVPGAGPGWLWTEPERLAAVAADLRERW